MITSWQDLSIPRLDGFNGFVPPQGTGTSGVMLVGEAPGEHEARYGVPFHPDAPAGSMLNRILARCGADRDAFTIVNTVWSRPPKNWLDGAPYEGEAIAAYRPFLDRAIEMYKPRIIVAMGGVALRALTGYGHSGTSISKVQGYVLDGPAGCWVIPCLHPAAIVRGDGMLKIIVMADPEALIFKGYESEEVTASVCGACGYT